MELDLSKITAPGVAASTDAPVMQTFKYGEETLTIEEVERRLKAYQQIRQKQEAEDVAAAQKAASEKMEKKIFKSVIPSLNYIFPSGKAAIFINGLYATDRENEIKHLSDEIAAGHPHIRHFDPKVDAPAELSGIGAQSVEALREYFFREFAQAQLNAVVGRDMGTTENTKLNPTNSANVAEAMAGGGVGLSAGVMQALNLMKTGNKSGVLKVDTLPIIGDKPQGNSEVPKLTELLNQQTR